MDGPTCTTFNAHALRVVQQLLWDVISHHLYPAERDEIRRALGRALLDENETLFAEAGALGDILGDVQLDTAALLARQAIVSNPQRSMVESEIRLLVERLHGAAGVTPFGSAAVRERDPDSLLPKEKGARDKAVLEYVATSAQIAENGGRPPSALPPRPPTALSASSRPGTSSRPPTSLSLSASASMTLPGGSLSYSRPGTSSPTTAAAGGGNATSRPSTAGSGTSSAAARYTDAPSVVAVVADRLNVGTIDAVRDTLREALMDERAALMEDVEYLQGLLEAEADLQVRAAAPPPSLAELRDYSSRLAAVVAGEEARVEHEVRVSAMFAAADNQPSKAGRLRGMVDASRRPTSASSSSGGGAAAGGGGGGLGGMAAGVTLSPVMAPPGRRSGGGLGSGSGSGNVQTLVVHHEEEVAKQQQEPRRRTPPSESGSSGGASVSTSVAAAGGVSGAGNGVARAPGTPPEGRRTASAVAAGAAASPSAAAMSSRGAAGLAAVRRPGSGGSSGVDGPSAAASTLRPVLPPTALRSSASPAPLPAVRPAAPDFLCSAAAVGSPAAAAAHLAKLSGAEANGGGQASPSSSGRLRQTSPGRLLQPGSGLASPAQASLPTPSHSHLHREPSPSLLAGAAHRSGGSATAGPGALRPLPPRSGSLSFGTPPERGGGAGVAASPAAAAAAASPSVPGSRSSSSSAAKSSSSTAAAAVCAPAPSAGGAVAARLAAAAAATEAAQPRIVAAVQPRALQGGKQNVVERLEAEVDAVKGGVAAILEKYNVRPSTPSGAAAAAPSGATGSGSGHGGGGSRGGS